MPSTPNPNAIEFNGRSGFRSHVTAHPDAYDFFVTFQDLWCDASGRIRKRFGRGSAKGASAASQIMSLWEFEYVNPTTGVSTFFVFRQFAAKIQRWGGAAWSDESLPIALTSGQLGSWLNIKNRCLFVNGADAALVFDGTNWRKVGQDPIAAAPTYALGGTFDSSTGGGLHTIAATQGSPSVAKLITGAAWDGVGPTYFMNGKYIDINGMRYTISTVDFSSGNITGTVTVVNGNANVVGAGTSFTTQLAKGSQILVGGTYAIVASIADDTHLTLTAVWSGGGAAGAACAAGSLLTLTEDFKEASYTGSNYAIHYGLMDWSEPPKYSAAYFNPTTGHVSNESPILQISEKDQVGVTPTITIAGSAANTTAYNAGYTKIKMFRTPKNGNRRVAINVDINNVNTGAAITFVEVAATCTDTALTELAAPINTNVPPPAGLAALSEYQGRAVGVKPADTPPRWYFSAINEELPFGRGEESWPARFSRPVTRPTGVLTIGTAGVSNSLIVQTGNGDYTFDGIDNLSYTNPIKLQTRGSGSFLGGAVEAHGSLAALYRDKRLVDFSVGDLGSPSQDRLDDINALYIAGSRLWWYSYQTLDWLFASYPKGAAQTTNNYTLIYDYDERLLYEWMFGFSCATTVHNTTTGDLELWIGDAAGNIYAVIPTTTFTDAGVNYRPIFKTCHIRREGLVEQLKHIDIFVAPPENAPQGMTWTVNVYLDEATSPTKTFTASTLNAMYESSQGMWLRVVPDTPLRSHVFQIEVQWPDTDKDVSIDKMVVVFEPDAEEAVEP